jgi:high affinity sulfate transporter 1
LLPDLVAGMTLAAYAIPVSLAYASLAGLPPQVGIYGYLLGGIGYALFGSSRQMAVGPTSAISLMVGGTLAQIAGGDLVLYGQIASLAGFVVAALSFLAFALRLSTLTNFISETILLGFKAGAGLTIASTQLASFLGVPGGGHNFFERVFAVASQYGEINPAIALFGLAALALLVGGEIFLPGRPVALLVVVLSIAAVSLSPLGRLPLTLVGSIPAGLPQLVLPSIHPSQIDGLLPLALGCLLLAYIEGVSAARTFAAKHGYALDARQEFLGLGSANLLAALGGGYPVAGGLSQSAVNDKSGAKTPLALVFASVTLALCLLFLTELVRNLPKAVLAAIVLVAVSGLIKPREMAHLRRVSRFEFRVAMVALGGVLFLGILKGVLLAAIATILALLNRIVQPPVAFLGRVPQTERFEDPADQPDVEAVPEALIFRVKASLLYFNADNVQQAVLDRVRIDKPRLVIADLSDSPLIDLSAVRMLGKLSEDLEKYGAVLRLAEIRQDTRELLQADGLGDKVGPIDCAISIAQVMESFHAVPGATATARRG